ncbi:MAG TPA: hypothetical protein VJR05_04420 [Acidimicrobiia bacterium]|nr:hypothetical protein [Acidimicrobiia bacterium]
MTKTDETRTESSPRPRALGWIVAAGAIVVLAIGGYWAFRQDRGPVVDPVTTNTTLTASTAAPEPEGTGAMAVIEEAVAAFYSGDGERAAELFELADRTDDQIRMEAAYQAAIGGQLTLNCTETSTLGTFNCNVPYHNALTDAVQHRDRPGDNNRVVVEDGIITAFGFPEHTFLVVSVGSFLAVEGRFDGYEDCLFGPFAENCALVQMENLEAWADWYDTVEPVTFVEAALQAWYGGDCATARYLSDIETHICSTPDQSNQTIAYESILGASVSLQGCEEKPAVVDDDANLTCEVHYSNAMNTAVGKAPSVTLREFSVYVGGIVGSADGDFWYSVDYPEDLELRESFRTFAESGDLADEYAASSCASTAQRTPECAALIVENLDAWAAWYESNG